MHKSTDIHATNVICFAIQTTSTPKMATGSVDGVVKVWGVARETEELFSLDNQELVCCLAIHDHTLLIGDKAGTLTMRHLQNGQIIRRLDIQSGPLVELILIQGG